MSDIKKYEQPKLPSVNELFTDNLQDAYKAEALNAILSTPPNPQWIKEHPYVKGYKYLPIDKVEYLLRRIFKRYRIEITGQGQTFNGVYVTVRVHFFNYLMGEFDFHDGIGAMQLQTKKDSSPAELQNINNGAISMAYPIAKTMAIKDACDHFGDLFGANLNRKDALEFSPNTELISMANPPSKEILTELLEQKAEVLSPQDFEDINRILEKSEVNNYYKAYKLLIK